MPRTPQEVAAILRTTADVIDKAGYPTEPFIVQGHPLDSCGLILVMWRPKTADRTTSVTIKPDFSAG